MKGLDVKAFGSEQKTNQLHVPVEKKIRLFSFRHWHWHWLCFSHLFHPGGGEGPQDEKNEKNKANANVNATANANGPEQIRRADLPRDKNQRADLPRKTNRQKPSVSQMKVQVVTLNAVQESSTSELSSGTFDHSKVYAKIGDEA